MVQLTNLAAMRSAAINAKASKLHVRSTSIFRQYIVENRTKGTEYRVNFFLTRGERWAECECLVAQNKRVCKHVYAAAGLHVMLAAARRQQASR